MNIYLSIIIVFIGIPLLGFGMFKAARWSRKKNEELKAKHEDSQEQALKDMFRGKKGSFANFYTSSIPEPDAIIGQVLALGVIIFIIILVLVLAYYGWRHI